MRLAAVAILPLLTLITGCAMENTATPSAVQGGTLKGHVHGGQQPYQAASVFLFAAGTSGYGGPSISLLQPGPTTTVDNNLSSATYLDAYTLTDINGDFDVTGEYSCNPGSQVYIYVYGGRPVGPNILANTAAGFLAALGSCPATGNFDSPNSFVYINEVTTVAAAYALAGFATDALHVSRSGTSLAQTGITNAFANAANLADITTGTALAITPAGNGTVPQAAINTLANILAACINSNDVTNPQANPRLYSDACWNLVQNATTDGTPTGGFPYDMANAAINIAHNPGANIANLFALSAASPPFLPALTSPPNDWTIGIQFALADLLYPYGPAIDASGNVWVSDSYGVGTVRFSPLGLPTVLPQVAGGYSSLAIDQTNNIWITSSITNSVFKISNLGSLISPSTGYSLDLSSSQQAMAIAIDGAGNAWVANSSNAGIATNSVSKLSSSGSLISPTSGYTGGGGTSGTSIAIDGSGNAWTPGVSLSKFAASGQAFGGYGGSAYGVVAIDASGDAWTASLYTGLVSEFSNSGAALSPPGGFGGAGLAAFPLIALDGGGNVWVANYPSSIGSLGDIAIAELSNDGTAISPATGYYATNFYGRHGAPLGIAVDGSGDVWVSTGTANIGPSSIVLGQLLELIGAATPVITPIAAGLPSTPTTDGSSNLGTRP